MEDGKVMAEDLQSTNGTYINGERIQKKAIKPQDKLKIGLEEYKVML
jgi:pSer/pThr/pTyr-binding forkhead associated (FHA) protein